MKFVKLFTLLAMLVGVWALNGGAVSAKTDCQADYAACTGTARDTRDNVCYPVCNGIIACEGVCDSQYFAALDQCDADYEACLNP
jgi:hypothetical protein